MKIYSFETQIGDTKICMSHTKHDEFTILSRLIYCLQWYSIALLFYLNTIAIHSRLFSVFLFLLAIAMFIALKLEHKCYTKEEYLEKINELLK